MKPSTLSTLIFVILAIDGIECLVDFNFHVASKPRQGNLQLSSAPKSSDHESASHDRLRRWFLALPMAAIFAPPVQPARSEVPPLALGVPESLSLETGLLEARVSENLLSPPPYGLEGPDVFYPSWFSGTWRVKSLTKRVEAPCGVALFGGNATYQNAKREVGTALEYGCRFLGSAESTTAIADREFNVKSIAKAAMGENSVLDIPLVTPNKFTCILAPKGSPSPLQVDLVVLNRRQEDVSKNRFDCSEVVREIISPVDKRGPTGSSPILKEIETISIYKYNEEQDEITCTQRSAAFLLPSQQSPLAMKMWEAGRGRPVDVRFYDVVYTKRR